jgi:NAD-specific glutamate dehydrogenase
VSKPEYLYAVRFDFDDLPKIERLEVLARGPKEARVKSSRASGWRRRIDVEILNENYSATGAEAVAKWRVAQRQRIEQLREEIAEVERSLEAAPKANW